MIPYCRDPISKLPLKAKHCLCHCDTAARLEALESTSLLGFIRLNRQSYIDGNTKNSSTLITLVMSRCHSLEPKAAAGIPLQIKVVCLDRK